MVEPSREKFSDEQARSAVGLLEQIAAVGGGASELQQEFVARARGLLIRDPQAQGGWQ